MKNSDPIFFPSSQIDLSLRQKQNRNYTDSINILQTQWYQADLNQRFCMADQDIWSQIFPTNLLPNRRKMFNFNIMNPIVQAITGQQRQTRKSSICIPIQSNMQKTADQMTKCLYYVHNKSGAYQVYSDAFEQGPLIQGFSLVSIFPDYTNDPISPDIRLRNVDFKSILIDPYFRRHDLSDCRYIWTRQFFDREEASILYPQFADQILSLPRGSYKDDKFYYMPEVYQIQFPNIIAFDEYWYLSTREVEYLIDRETEECQEFMGDEEDLRVIMQTFGKRLKVIRRSKPTVRRTLTINDKVLVDEPNPYGIDRYPYVGFYGYFSPDTPYYAYKFRSVCSDLKDAQFLFNRMKIGDLDIVEAQQQGYKIRQGSLVTPDDALNQGHGRSLFYKKDASPDDIQNMDIHPPSPVMLQMEESLMQVIYRIAGMDPSAMGIDVDDKAGIISMMRQAATARNLQRLFDQFDESQRLCGDIILEMIQKNWTYGKVKQVIGENPTAEFDNKAFFKYGCKVVQGVLTESQQQLELAQLLHLQQLAPDIFPKDEIIEAMTIQNKDRIIQKLEAAQKAQQEQMQKREQIELEHIQLKNRMMIAEANSKDGLAMERIGKLQLDKALNAERIQRAEQDRSASALNLVKAIKELQSIDLNHLGQYLDIVDRLKDDESEKGLEENKKPLTESGSMSMSEVPMASSMV
jgi:hypothetical protein